LLLTFPQCGCNGDFGESLEQKLRLASCTMGALDVVMEEVLSQAVLIRGAIRLNFPGWSCWCWHRILARRKGYLQGQETVLKMQLGSVLEGIFCANTVHRTRG
jgi:hypothetical protein